MKVNQILIFILFFKIGTSYSQITEFFKFGGNIQTSVECLKNKEEFKIINSRLLKQIWQLKYDSTYQTYKVEIGELKSKNHIIHGTYETFSERFNKPKESYTKKTFKHGVQVGKSIEYQNNLVQDSVIYNEIGELIYRWTIDLNKNLANDILIYEANFNNSKISQGIVYNSKKLKLHSMKFKVNEATEINEFYPNGKLKYKFFSKYIDNHLKPIDEYRRSEGLFYEYFENGNLKEFGLYERNQKIKNWVYFDSKGRKKVVDEGEIPPALPSLNN